MLNDSTYFGQLWISVAIYAPSSLDDTAKDKATAEADNDGTQHPQDDPHPDTDNWCCDYDWYKYLWIVYRRNH